MLAEYFSGMFTQWVADNVGHNWQHYMVKVYTLHGMRIIYFKLIIELQVPFPLPSVCPFVFWMYIQRYYPPRVSWSGFMQNASAPYAHLIKTRLMIAVCTQLWSTFKDKLRDSISLLCVTFN